MSALPALLAALDRSQQAAVAAGVGVAAAALLGSLPTGWLLARRRLRGGMRRLDAEALVAGPGPDPDDAPPASLRRTFAGTPWSASEADLVLALVVDVAKVLVAATLAWHLVQALGPPYFRPSQVQLSAIGFTSNQVTTYWQSAGLWCGLVAVIAHLAPPWLSFRGRTQGVAPGLALALVYAPTGFLAAAAAFFPVLLVTRRPVAATLSGAVAAVATSWWLWVTDGPRLWGVVTGPEVGLWSLGLAGVVVARVLADRPA